jgi:hypothetical protein
MVQNLDTMYPVYYFPRILLNILPRSSFLASEKYALQGLPGIIEIEGQRPVQSMSKLGECKQDN